MRILDLGCGIKKYKPDVQSANVVGLDYTTRNKPDVLWDMNKIPLPFKDNEFDVVYSHHAIEHIMPENRLALMWEIHRITKPKGIVNIITPHFSVMAGSGVLDHIGIFSYSSFYRLTTWEKHPDKEDYHDTPKFRMKSARIRYSEWHGKVNPLKKIFGAILEFFANLNIHFSERFWCYWFGGFSEIEVKMEVVK